MTRDDVRRQHREGAEQRERYARRLRELVCLSRERVEALESASTMEASRTRAQWVRAEVAAMRDLRRVDEERRAEAAAEELGARLRDACNDE